MCGKKRCTNARGRKKGADPERVRSLHSFVEHGTQPRAKIRIAAITCGPRETGIFIIRGHLNTAVLKNNRPGGGGLRESFRADEEGEANVRGTKLGSERENGAKIGGEKV